MVVDDVELSEAMEVCKQTRGHSVIVFLDPSSSACMSFAKLMQELPADLQLRVCRVDVTLEAELMQKFPTAELPVLYFFSNGLSVGRKPAFRTVVEFKDWLRFLDGLC